MVSESSTSDERLPDIKWNLADSPEVRFGEITSPLMITNGRLAKTPCTRRVPHFGVFVVFLRFAFSQNQ